MKWSRLMTYRHHELVRVIEWMIVFLAADHFMIRAFSMSCSAAILDVPWYYTCMEILWAIMGLFAFALQAPVSLMLSVIVPHEFSIRHHTAVLLTLHLLSAVLWGVGVPRLASYMRGWRGFRPDERS